MAARLEKQSMFSPYCRGEASGHLPMMSATTTDRITTGYPLRRRHHLPCLPCPHWRIRCYPERSSKNWLRLLGGRAHTNSPDSTCLRGWLFPYKAMLRKGNSSVGPIAVQEVAEITAGIVQVFLSRRCRSAI